MKKLIVFIFSIALFINGSSQTQLEMNYELKKSYDNADEELNAVYQAILKKYSSDTTFIKNLRISQRIWIKFRDAELSMKFPDRSNNRLYYGSVFPMCVSSYLKTLTESRIKTLRIWIDGAEEGDVCSGSLR